VNVLVRIPYQKIFYREVFVLGGRSILFPDSLNCGIVGAFIGTMPTLQGVDTIRVFASIERQLTIRIRQLVGSSGQSGLNRGLITFSDEPIIEPAAYENAHSAERPYSQDAYPQHTGGSAFPCGEQKVGCDPGAAYESEPVDPL
jgi:hypothetical protein